MEALTVNGTEYSDEKEAVRAIRRSVREQRKRDRAEANAREHAHSAALATLGLLAYRVFSKSARKSEAIPIRGSMVRTHETWGYAVRVEQGEDSAEVVTGSGIPAMMVEWANGDTAAVRIDRDGEAPAWFAVGVRDGAVYLLDVPPAMAEQIERVGG